MENRLFLSLLDPGLYVYDPTGRSEDTGAARDAAYGRQIDAIRARAMVATIFGARLVLPEGWAVCSMPALTVVAEAWRARQSVAHELGLRNLRPAPLSPFAVGYFRAGGTDAARPGFNGAEKAESFLQMYHRRLAADAAPLEGIEFLNARDTPDGGDRRRRLREVIDAQLRLNSGHEPLRDVSFGAEEFYGTVADILPDPDYAEGIVALSEMAQRRDALRERVYLRDARGEIDKALPALLMRLAEDCDAGRTETNCAAAIRGLLQDAATDRTPSSNFARMRAYLERYDPVSCEAMIGAARQLVNRTLAAQTEARLAEQTVAAGETGADVVLRAQHILAETAGAPRLGSGEACTLYERGCDRTVDWIEVWKGVWRIALDRRFKANFEELRRDLERMAPDAVVTGDAWARMLEAINTEVDFIRLTSDKSALSVRIARRYRSFETQTAAAPAVSGFAFGLLASQTVEGGGLAGGLEGGAMIVSITTAALFAVVGLSNADIASSLLRRDLAAERKARVTAFAPC